MFLVKGGEDLRNDERIQLLFVLMNQVIIDSSFSTKEEQQNDYQLLNSNVLRARTYTVIPMNSKVGLLEWVENTTPLKAIITEEMARDNEFKSKNIQAYNDVEKIININALQSVHAIEQWISKDQISSDDYHSMLKSKNQHSANTLYESAVVSEIPDCFIRNRLLRMARG
jgi:hypothetical protein